VIVPQAFVAVLLLLAAALAAYWPTLSSLLRFWNDYDNLSYTHGYLIAAICGWLLWRARFAIAAATRGFSATGMLLLLAASVAWAVAWLAAIEVGHQALLPVLLLAAVATFGGWRAARAAALPVAYLYFAIPVWDQINGALQQLTIVAVTGLLKLLAIPAIIDGPYVHLGSGSFEIAGGCSGLHFFIVACAIAVLYGEIGHDTLRTRIKLLLIAGAMAIVMNWVRVSTIIIAGYLTDMQSFLVKVDHYYFGWALFGVLLVIFYWLVPRWLKLQANPPPAVPATLPQLPRGRLAGALAATVVLLALVPTLALRAQANAVAAAGTTTAALPVPAGWTGPLAASSNWSPDFPAADGTERASYRRGDTTIESYVATYAWQAQGKEMVGYGNDVLAARDGAWRLRHSDTWSAGSAGVDTRYRRAIIRDEAGADWVILHQYRVGGRTFTGGLVSKLYYPIALAGGHAPASIVAAAARCDTDCETATRDVAAFLASLATKVTQ
jgi:exosortase A